MEVCNGVEDNEMNCDLASYSTMCEDIRQIISQVVGLKTNTTIKSEDKKSEITELRMQGSFHFLSLKQLNRSAQVRCKQVKDRTLEAKQKLDGYNLQLENLQYEISHLHKEITKCLEFRSRHDDIALVPLEEFYKNAPKEISNEEVTMSDEHTQTLSRLDWELEQRKKLSEFLKQLKIMKKGVTNDISDKKQHLQALNPGLQNLLKSSLQLQEALDIPLDRLKKQHDRANLLPRPLFVLFLQAKAYQEACDSLMQVSIDGDVELAEKLHRMETSMNRSSVVDVAGGDESDSDMEEDLDSTHGRRSRKQKDREAEGSQPPKSVLSSHPLLVNIQLSTTKNGPLLCLAFSYLPTLKFVAVKGRLEEDKEIDKLASSIFDEDNLLCCLQPLDYGTCPPNLSAKYPLQQAGCHVADILSTLGRPYMWAQKLCGLEFPCDQVASMQMSFTHMQGTIQALRHRLRSRTQLAIQVEQFCRKVVMFEGQEMLCIPDKMQSALTSWTFITEKEYKRLGFTSPVVDLELLGSNEDSHLYFLATVAHSSGVSVQVAIVIFNDYPRTSPLIALRLDVKGTNQSKTAINDVNIREMEAEVNIRLPMMNEPKHKDYVISFQLTKLMTLLDVYVAAQHDQSMMPVETGSNRISEQRRKGPARLKPFVFDAGSGSHHHRGME